MDHPIDTKIPIKTDANTARVEAFSDGVFAIAITLLVLDLRVPSINDSPDGIHLLEALSHDWPIYFAFVTSFLTVLIMWMNHRRMFTMIHKVDHTMLLLNGLLLFGVTVVPFPTKLLAQYLLHQDAAVAAIIFNVWFAVISVLFNLIWWYASENDCLRDFPAAPEIQQTIRRRYMFGPPAYLVAAAVALISPILSTGLNLLLAVFYALPAQQFDDGG